MKRLLFRLSSLSVSVKAVIKKNNFFLDLSKNLGNVLTFFVFVRLHLENMPTHKVWKKDTEGNFLWAAEVRKHGIQQAIQISASVLLKLRLIWIKPPIIRVSPPTAWELPLQSRLWTANLQIQTRSVFGHSPSASSKLRANHRSCSDGSSSCSLLSFFSPLKDCLLFFFQVLFYSPVILKMSPLWD